MSTPMTFWIFALVIGGIIGIFLAYIPHRKNEKLAVEILQLAQNLREKGDMLSELALDGKDVVLKVENELLKVKLNAARDSALDEFKNFCEEEMVLVEAGSPAHIRYFETLKTLGLYQTLLGVGKERAEDPTPCVDDIH